MENHFQAEISLKSELCLSDSLLLPSSDDKDRCVTRSLSSFDVGLVVSKTSVRGDTGDEYLQTEHSVFIRVSRARRRWSE